MQIHDSLNGLRALVVEDEALIAEELRERLTRRGLRIVGVVDTGEGAIELAEKHQPELVLMDIRLKGQIDGIAAAEAIRVNVKAPVVFLTAHSDQETLQRAKQANPFGYVLKPFNDRDLAVAIEMSLHRHSLEMRLEESEQRYAATLASIGDGVIATDPAGRITFMNPIAEALTEWRLSEAREREIDQVFPIVIEATRAARENPLREAIRRRQPVQLNEPVMMVARDREAIPIDDSAAPIIGNNDQLLGAVMAFRDLRERRRTEDTLQHTRDQLRQAQKMEAIGRLAEGIAHDFNNLLTVINGYAELLLRISQGESGSQHLLNEIHKAGIRAAGLTRQLLTFSRKQVLQPTILDLAKLVADMSRMLERLIGEDVVLTTTWAPDLWPMRADPSQIEQVILNLAVNARDAMPQGGRLTIEASNVELTEGPQAHPQMPPGSYLLLVVSDTGIGMDEATRERVFEPFFTTKDPGKGTGLGLATAYGIVKQSGGFIWLDSEIGQGTTFKLYFPAVRDATLIAKPTRVDSNTLLSGDEVILLVEDDDAVRSLISSALRRYGYTVHEASGGDKAMAHLVEHGDAIDLVVTDVVMQGMSGREISERARTTRPGVKVLFLSGYTDDAMVRHGVQEGEMELLQKPFTLTALAQKVREVLDRSAGDEQADRVPPS